MAELFEKVKLLKNIVKHKESMQGKLQQLQTKLALLIAVENTVAKDVVLRLLDVRQRSHLVQILASLKALRTQHPVSEEPRS